MKENVLVISGDQGSGKTTFATQLAEMISENYMIVGGLKDPFREPDYMHLMKVTGVPDLIVFEEVIESRDQIIALRNRIRKYYPNTKLIFVTQAFLVSTPELRTFTISKPYSDNGKDNR